MSLALRIAPLVLVAAVFQVSAVAGTRILGAEPDLVLVTVVAIGFVAGSVAGAGAGFAAGLLVVSVPVLAFTLLRRPEPDAPRAAPVLRRPPG